MSHFFSRVEGDEKRKETRDFQAFIPAFIYFYVHVSPGQCVADSLLCLLFLLRRRSEGRTFEYVRTCILLLQVPCQNITSPSVVVHIVELYPQLRL